MFNNLQTRASEGGGGREEASLAFGGNEILCSGDANAVSEGGANCCACDAPIYCIFGGAGRGITVLILNRIALISAILAP